MTEDFSSPAKASVLSRAFTNVAAVCAVASMVIAAPGCTHAQPARGGLGTEGAAIRVIGPGPSNSITDVPGIKVGHYARTDSGYRTGTTVVRTETGATAGYSQLGGAPGTKETDLLKPGGYVRAVQAIVLSGGSAYGLDAATGVMQWMEERGYGVPVPGGVVPIVPAAILFDLARGGDFKKRPDASFGYKAADAATSQPVKSGRYGAGMGAGWGLGTASVKLSNGYTVGAIVALNPAGSPIDMRNCLPYGVFLELGKEFNLVAPSIQECSGTGGSEGGGLLENGAPRDGSDKAPTNTTLAVIATDAPLLDLEAERMAEIANAGLARSIRPIHNIGDGDTVFGLATTPFKTQLSNNDLQAIFNAAADVLGRAVVHAVIESPQVGNSRVGYCKQYPSACVRR